MIFLQFQSGNLGQYRNVSYQNLCWVTGDRGVNVPVKPDSKTGAENVYRNTQSQPAVMHLHQKLSIVGAIWQLYGSEVTSNYKRVVYYVVKSTPKLHEVPFNVHSCAAWNLHVYPLIITKVQRSASSTWMGQKVTWIILKLKNTGHISFEFRDRFFAIDKSVRAGRYKMLFLGIITILIFWVFKVNDLCENLYIFINRLFNFCKTGEWKSTFRSVRSVRSWRNAFREKDSGGRGLIYIWCTMNIDYIIQK